MKILLLHWIESFEDETAQGNIYVLFYGLLIIREDKTVLGYPVGASVVSFKGYKYANLGGIVDGELNM